MQDRPLALPHLFDRAETLGINTFQLFVKNNKQWFAQPLEEDALVHWCATHALKARPLRIVGYGEDEAEDGPAHEGATA